MIVKNLAGIKERFDNRKIEELREFGVERISNSCLVRMGASQLLATFQKSTSKPYIDRPHEGIISFSASTGGKRYERLLNFLHKVYIKQKSIDLESLCVKLNEEVVFIHIDLRVLSSDGNIYGLAVKGVNSVLEALGVRVNYVPQCFSYCSIGSVIITDPSEDEQKEGDWNCVIVMKSPKEIVLLEKVGKECEIENMLEVVERSARSFVMRIPGAEGLEECMSA
ncbi:RNase PH-like exoribonuclease [Encephalitozoon hellem ATCC 50504]|uniref:Ribosomal RNA-processing protein 42 n=1 Tax=Encephalitozoon hellem TaxID=27973 RepID=A0A9Q9F8E6_ENCHE|nr:RNase PH-like exoribonuclease [Encephalitozoon hellem ATCC 50504]AFM98406.1 RNase PH-like exoribonuclease [Encephalitozoon hellem ATCC 50504]UTX43328.1 exosome complex component RRP42 [Encephalitozoon hellem]WEL38790.1 exosome complex component RRP42 [Encephalitozoon hellem]|eukprot:XP_003887387.1 RNase PH-like exoribonuclease [Encephalitozoon hellem ATCC 50504]